MLEPDEGKLSRPVLRAGGGSNPASLTRRQGFLRVRLSYPAGAGENLARGQEGEQCSEDRRRELRLPLHQIILVTTERRPGVMVHVVLDE